MFLARRDCLGFLAGGLLGAAGRRHALCAESAGHPVADERLRSAAQQIHELALTLDSHVDIAGPHYATAELDPGVDNPRLKCDLAKMAAGRVDGVFLAAFVGQRACDADGYRQARQAAVEKIAAIRRLATAMYPDRCALATSPDDVARICAAGRRAIMIGIENGYALGTDLSSVGEFHDLGVRYITLCHNGHNQLCDSCNPSRKLADGPARHGGLSPLGRQVVAEMNRLGMMIDLSHAAASSFRDAVALSGAPVIASHSGCAAVHNHPRNLDDEQLKMLAAKGGVIQIVALGAFLGPAPAGLKQFADHVDHAVRVAGVDHVGIGSDFDGGGGIPGFNNHAEALNVTVELLRRGYTAEAVTKIWGGNLLRVWRAVLAPAR